MNCPDFELLSAHADGETTPEEAALVNQHSAECIDCARQLANLGYVSRAIRLPQLLPVGFQILVQPRPKPSLWRKILSDVTDSPVAHLVSAQRRRRSRFGVSAMLRMMAIFALPVLYMSLFGDRSPLAIFIAISSVGLMVGMPLRQFSEEVAMLASLRRGRCLEEIVTTAASPQGLLDGLAMQGLLQIGRAALTVWPVLMLGSLGLPGYWKHRALEMEILWLPFLLGLFLAGYYLAQLIQVSKGGWLRRTGRLAVVLFPWTLALFGPPGCLAATFIMAMAARLLAIDELENPERPRAVPLKKRNPLVRGWTENPIARREMSRLASQIGGNWHRLLLWRASVLVLPVIWGHYASQQPIHTWPDVLAMGVLLFSALFFVRCALRTLPSVVREREQQSWEILMQTPLGTRTFVSGWLQVCLYTVFSESLAAVLALAGYAMLMVPPEQRLKAAAGLLLLPAMSVLGAYVGLALSASSRTLRESAQCLLLWTLGGGLGWLLTMGLSRGILEEAFDKGAATRWGFFNHPELYNHPTILGLGSLAAMLPVALLMGLRAWWLMSLLPTIDPGESRQVARYSPTVLCLDLASLGLLYYGLSAWNSISGAAQLSAFKGATLLLVSVPAWWWGLRWPLATLCEWMLGRRFSLLLGAGLGVGLGWALQTAWDAYAFSHGAIDESRYSNLLQWVSSVLGLVLGIAARQRRPIGRRRRQALQMGAAWWMVAAGLTLSLSTLLAWRLQVPPSTSGQLIQSSRYVQQLQTLDRIRWEQVPHFGSAQADQPIASIYSLNSTLRGLHSQARFQQESGRWSEALNTYRWCLLCCDFSESLQADFELVSPDDTVILEGIRECLENTVLDKKTGDDLAQQLLDDRAVLRRLKATFRYKLDTADLWNRFPLLPAWYLQREHAAVQLGLVRAEQSMDQGDLYSLRIPGPEMLLPEVLLCPLARLQLAEPQLRVTTKETSRSLTLREGLAWLVVIQRYRQEHRGRWPATLEELQGQLPRKPRSFMGYPEFRYDPGQYLVGTEAGASPSVLIYLEKSLRHAE